MDTSIVWITAIFILGYLGIIFEHTIKVDKAAIALVTGILCWLLFFNLHEGDLATKIEQLNHHLSGIAQVLFFLIGAMLVVEVIDSHQGFQMLGSMMHFQSRIAMFWASLLIGFFVSAALDNLTTIIVMIALLKKLMPDARQRLFFTAPLVVAVNAGGAWTPIGDVTTTMLWIADRVSSMGVIRDLFIPSIGSLLVFGLLMMLQLPRELTLTPPSEDKRAPVGSKRVFWIGVAVLIMVPVLKTVLGLPPFLGISFGVGILWVVTDLLHYETEERHYLRIFNSFGRIDMTCIYFFFGMLLAVDALEAAGILRNLATLIDFHIGSNLVIATLIGLVSAVVDNIPLVAACIEMYPLTQYGTDPVSYTHLTLPTTSRV